MYHTMDQCFWFCNDILPQSVVITHDYCSLSSRHLCTLSYMHDALYYLKVFCNGRLVRLEIIIIPCVLHYVYFWSIEFRVKAGWLCWSLRFIVLPARILFPDCQNLVFGTIQSDENILIVFLFEKILNQLFENTSQLASRIVKNSRGQRNILWNTKFLIVGTPKDCYFKRILFLQAQIANVSYISSIINCVDTWGV